MPYSKWYVVSAPPGSTCALNSALVEETSETPSSESPDRLRRQERVILPMVRAVRVGDLQTEVVLGQPFKAFQLRAHRDRPTARPRRRRARFALAVGFARAVFKHARGHRQTHPGSPHRQPSPTFPRKFDTAPVVASGTTNAVNTSTFPVAASEAYTRPGRGVDRDAFARLQLRATRTARPGMRGTIRRDARFVIHIHVVARQVNGETSRFFTVQPLHERFTGTGERDRERQAFEDPNPLRGIELAFRVDCKAHIAENCLRLTRYPWDLRRN